jgi:AcrR family transcriptional regulator
LLRRASAHFAQHGIQDASLRTIASAIGTSHRMLIYHFGSREQLLAAVVEDLWRDQRAVLAQRVGASDGDLLGTAWGFWTAMVDAGAVGPLLFELSAPAMHGAPWVESFREGGAALTAYLRDLLLDAGAPADRADVVARMSMAVVRGALWELAITADRTTVDATVRAFLEEHWNVA